MTKYSFLWNQEYSYQTQDIFYVRCIFHYVLCMLKVQIHLGITRQRCWLIRCLKWMKTGRYMQNCYPFSKFDGLVAERRSLFLSSRIRAFHHWKNTPFSRKWVRALIDALIGRGRFKNPYTKHMIRYHLHFQFFVCFVCPFFMSSLLSNWRGFMGHIA